MRTPLARVYGLGSARNGTEHFWYQRLTGLANAVLVTLCVVLVLRLQAAQDYFEALEIVASPFVSFLLLLLVVSGAFHMKLGMQTIIEDYIHAPLLKSIALAGNVFFCSCVGGACAFALLKISGFSLFVKLIGFLGA